MTGIWQIFLTGILGALCVPAVAFLLDRKAFDEIVGEIKKRMKQ